MRRCSVFLFCYTPALSEKPKRANFHFSSSTKAAYYIFMPISKQSCSRCGTTKPKRQNMPLHHQCNYNAKDIGRLCALFPFSLLSPTTLSIYVSTFYLSCCKLLLAQNLGASILCSSAVSGLK